MLTLIRNLFKSGSSLTTIITGVVAVSGAIIVKLFANRAHDKEQKKLGAQEEQAKIQQVQQKKIEHAEKASDNVVRDIRAGKLREDDGAKTPDKR